MAKKEANINKKENNKNKRSFFKDFKAELKKVSWPTPKQLVNNTTAVITIVLITAAIVFVLDLAFEAINKKGIDKVKEVISANTSISEDSTTENEDTDTDESSENVQAEENTTETENAVDTSTENTNNNESTQTQEQ